MWLLDSDILKHFHNEIPKHQDMSELKKGYSPDTHTLIRVPGPDYVMKDNLADYAVEASMKIIDGFSRVRSSY